VTIEGILERADLPNPIEEDLIDAAPVIREMKKDTAEDKAAKHQTAA
jgi:hypothetical protein